MALQTAEITALKDSIPARFRPSANHADLLGSSFCDAADTHVSAAPVSGGADLFKDDHARELAGLALINNPDASTGFMLTGALTVMRTAKTAKAAERKREDQRRVALDHLMAQLDAQLAKLNAELAQIDERLDKIRKRRIELGDSLEALDDLEQLHASGTLDPENPAHAAMLRRAGIIPEDVRGHDMHDIIAQRRRDMSREDGALESEWNDRMKRRAEVMGERQEVKAARAEIEGADTPEAMEQAEQRARSVLGAQQLGEAAFQTESDKAKVIAADAVATNEHEDLRTDSLSYNHSAVELDDSMVIRTDDATLKF